MDDLDFFKRIGMSYCQHTGHVTKRGKPVGWRTEHGYMRASLMGRCFMLHRVAWTLFYGVVPDGQIDHIDGNRANNRIANLRVVSNSENGRNQGLRRENASGVVGVSRHINSGKWQAYINANGKRKYLGLFNSIDEAASARHVASCEFGYHENHGARPVALSV